MPFLLPCAPVPPTMVTTDQAKITTGTTLGGRYELDELIGEGGFGKIYRGRQINMERDVAIKILPPRFAAVDNIAQRFRREARLASKLRHPNTITLHDYGQEDDFFYIVMEFLQGEDLADRLMRQETIGLDVAVRIARQTLQSLQEAHELGIVHRDLKPENIFLTQMGADTDFVKVLDFGIAKMASNASGAAVDDKGRQLTVQGNTVGTPVYMSPEQAAGEPLSATSDLYTMGLILYEMVNGAPPFVKDRPIRTMRAHLFDPVPAFKNKELRNSRFESIVRKALAKDPADRYASADDFDRALSATDLSSQQIGFHRLGADDAGSGGHAFNPPGGLQDRQETGVDDSSSQSTPKRRPRADEVPFETVADDGPQTADKHQPPAGFSSQGAITSSIITVLEPHEEDVIVLTQKKNPSETEPPAKDREIPESEDAPGPDLMAESAAELADADSTKDDFSPESSLLSPLPDDPGSDWEWGDDTPVADASGSQILRDFDVSARPRRFLILAGLLMIALLAAAYISGWFNL